MDRIVDAWGSLHERLDARGGIRIAARSRDRAPDRGYTPASLNTSFARRVPSTAAGTPQ